MAKNNAKIDKLKDLIAKKILDELVNMGDDTARWPEQITIDWADLYTEEEEIAIREGPKKRKGQCPTCKYSFYSKDASQLYCSGARCDNPDESSVGIKLCEVVLTTKDSPDVAEMDYGVTPSETTSSSYEAEYASMGEAFNSTCPLFCAPKPGQPGQWRVIANCREGRQNDVVFQTEVQTDNKGAVQMAIAQQATHGNHNCGNKVTAGRKMDDDDTPLDVS
jgi:hypothetical protein